MSKILIVTSEARYSGPNNVVLSLVKAAALTDMSVDVLALRKKAKDNYINDLKSNGGNVYLKSILGALIFLAKACYDKKYKIINTHGIRADLIGYLLSVLYNTRFIATIHNIPSEDYIMRYGKIKGEILLSIHKIVFKTKKIVKLCVSQSSKEHLETLGGVNVHRVYNGLNPNDFYKLYGDDRCKVEDKLGLAKDKVRVVFCGHLSNIKNPTSVVEAAKFLPELDFIFLGDGPLYNTPLEIGNCTFSGRVDNVVEYYSISDIFIMPSMTEGMPMALIEAMFSGLVVVCSDIPIFNEIKQLDDFDIIISGGSPEEIADSISLAVNKINNNNNRTVASKYFSNEKMLEAYISCT